MNPVVEYYVRPKGLLPPDPLQADLCVHRVPGETVYSVLPFTVAGWAFLVDHESAGSAHGDLLLVPMRNIFPFMNEIFDEGLRVV